MLARALQLDQDQDTMGQPATPTDLPRAAASIALPSPYPAAGILCTASKGLTYDDLVFLVTSHPLQHPLPVRPVVMGFLPFDDGQISPRYLLKAQDLLIMRWGVVSKTVPPSAIRRLMVERQDAYLAEFGEQMPAMAARLLRSDCITALLATALASERDALIFYKPSTGQVFLAESGWAQAQAILQALGTFLPNLACKAWRPGRTAGDELRKWVLDGSQPDTFQLGDSLKLTTAGGTTVAFRNANMLDPELLSHLDEGSVVAELGLTQGRDAPEMTFAFDSAGVLRRIRLGSARDLDGLAGLSRLLAGLVEFADAVFPCAGRLMSAIRQDGGRHED